MRVPKLSAQPPARQISEQAYRKQNPNAPRSIMPDDKAGEALSAFPTALQ